jgi:SPP1 family predicted phage head-tail adaptor
MISGSRDRLVAFEQRSVTRDSYGAEIVSWVEHARAWAQVREYNSVERVGDGLRTVTTVITVTTLWVAGVDESMRIRVLDSDRLLQITSLAVVGRNSGLSMRCEVYSA